MIAEFARIKTQPTIGDTTIQLKSVSASNYVVGAVAIFGSDQGPNNAGYAITAYDSTNQTITISSGILTAAAVDTPIYLTCTNTPQPSSFRKF